MKVNGYALSPVKKLKPNKNIYKTNHGKSKY